MENVEALTPRRSEDLVGGSAEIDFHGTDTDGTEAAQRGGVRTLLSEVAGSSMPQVTRLIRQYQRTGELRVNRGVGRRFPIQYTEEDAELLVAVNGAHQRLSGPASRTSGWSTPTSAH